MDLLLLNAITANSLIRAHSGASPVLRESNAGWLTTLALPGVAAKVSSRTRKGESASRDGLTRPCRT